MTILESICTNVVEFITSDEVLEECKRQPAPQRAAFMTTFAVYIEWVTLRICHPLFDANDYSLISSEIRKSFANQHWFSVDLYNEIAPAAKQRLDTMKPGRQTGILMPLVHAIEGANAVGHMIQHSTDARFAMYPIAAWQFMSAQIPKLCGMKPT